MKCSECDSGVMYENYIDADDGRGERLVCLDCAQKISERIVHIYEDYPETNYWQSVDSSNNFIGFDPGMDYTGYHIYNVASDRSFNRTLEMARELEGLE